MSDFLESTLFVLAVIVFVIVLPFIWLCRNRRAAKAKRHELRQVQKAQFEQRQLNPDFAAFAAHYGCEPPPPLRQLYADRAMVLDDDFDVTVPSGDTYSIAWIEPMDEREWPDVGGEYSIANDGCGNAFLINPREADPEVFFLDHETGERDSLGVRLSQFLTLKRVK